MSLISELKRRNVIRVAIAYLVIGWLLAQVSSTFESAFNLPSWFDTTVISFLIIGFPIAFLISWVYELTPDGIKKEIDINADDSITRETAKKLDYITIIAALAVVGMVAWQKMSPKDMDSGMRGKDKNVVIINDISNNTSIPPLNTQTKLDNSEIKNNTIAVLPFIDMSPNRDQGYFSDGISEEILNVLAKIPELQVTSRTSAFSFKDTNTDIATIAKKLGVENILEGSVRKSGSKVRITAQLIDAKTDKHLWSETYNRELTDIFLVQDEISTAIATALKETLDITITKPKYIAKNIDPLAHDLYLKGLQQVHQFTFDSLATSVESFKASLAIDPDFSLAKLALAKSLIFQIFTGSKSNLDLLKQAETLTRDVLEKDSESSLAYMNLSFIHRLEGEWEKRVHTIDKAYQMNPNNAMAIVFYVGVHRETISETKSTNLFNKAQQLDPLNAEIPYYIGALYFVNPQTRNLAESYTKQAIKLNLKSGNYPYQLGHIYGFSFADLPKAIEQYKILQKIDSNDPDGSIYLSHSYHSIGDGETALIYANKALKTSPNSADAYLSKIAALILQNELEAAQRLINQVYADTNIFFRIDHLNAKIYLLRYAVHLLLKQKDYQKALALIENYAPGTENLINKPAPQTEKEVGDPVAIGLLSTVYRAQGKEQLAIQLADRLDLLLGLPFPLNINIIKVDVDLIKANVFSIQNKQEAAIDYLTTLIDDGYVIYWRSNILYNPVFAKLHDHPRYQALIKRIETKMLYQRKIVDAIDNNITKTSEKQNESI